MRHKIPWVLLVVSILTMGAAAPVRMTPVEIADNVYLLQQPRGLKNSTPGPSGCARFTSFITTN